MNVFCIAGKAESGKTTFAEMIINNCPDKKILLIQNGDMLKWTADKLYHCGYEKNEENREIWQKFGTDVVREKVDPIFWTKMVTMILQVARVDNFDAALIPDTRFPDEVSHPKNKGFKVETVHIVRPDHKSILTPEQLLHPSETAMDGYAYDYTIFNDGSLASLEEEAVKFAKEVSLK